MLNEIYHLESWLKKEKLKIKALSPVEFETFVSNLLKDLGFSVSQTPPTNDGGKDIVAHKDGKTYYIECKHFSEGAVGREIIQKLIGAGMIDGNVDGFIVVTSSYFNSNAIECAEKFKNLLLWDLEDIMYLIRLKEGNNAHSSLEHSLRRFELNSANFITMDLVNCGDEFYVNFRNYKNNVITESFLLPVDMIDTVAATLKTVPTRLSMLTADKKVGLIAKKSIPAAAQSSKMHKTPKGMIGWRNR